ncbi:sulphydryl oxidase Sox [Paracoccidioides lutzii Pb01]|uniref:Sulphydryl oxidase Sox n=1 Tax=Paracoccidioides lutzii (strain ATCC MYA-826 / Pb01) TaxID=502779 RepID=C1GRP4_PARBA|nr:sulphydryl oxidase Sox [Paracoccidioides lutzii Pb01]EEH38268.1 sulphydryl oxidase Sox [Paracoccidioides lutzii Pb01]
MATVITSGWAAFLFFLTFTFAQSIPAVDYDAIIVGGGPAGLSALSSLSRVRRTALLVDSGIYRNGLTRFINDIIGADGVAPSAFRHKARKQIARYATAEMRNGTVLHITQVNNVTGQLPYFNVNINFTDTIPPSIVNRRARKIVLATGIEDILPNTPGIDEAWSRGIYWCPWCDGFEHRDQPLGIIGNATRFRHSIMEVATLNHDIMAFMNGTELPDDQIKHFETHYHIHYKFDIIKNITRVQDGATHFSAQNRSQFDIFTVHFHGDTQPVNRSAFVTNFESKQRSDLPYKLGLKMAGINIDNDIHGMLTSTPGVYAVGDCNNDRSTNVPHAMFSGKRAAITIHISMEEENSTAMSPEIGKRTQPLSSRELEALIERKIGNEFEALWPIRREY